MTGGSIHSRFHIMRPGQILLRTGNAKSRISSRDHDLTLTGPLMFTLLPELYVFEVFSEQVLRRGSLSPHYAARVPCRSASDVGHRIIMHLIPNGSTFADGSRQEVAIANVLSVQVGDNTSNTGKLPMNVSRINVGAIHW